MSEKGSSDDKESTDNDESKKKSSGKDSGSEESSSEGGKEQKKEDDGKEKSSDDDSKGKAGKDNEEGGGDGEGGKEGKNGEDKGKEKGLSKKTIVIGVIVFLILLAGGILYWLHARKHESTDDAYVTGHLHQISSRVAGTVIEVWVDDNQKVKKGDLLAKLDVRDYEVALERAEANLEQSRAQVPQAEAAVAQARAGVEQAEAQVSQSRAMVAQSQAQLDVATINFNRNNGLFTKDLRAVAKADVDTTQGTLNGQRAALDGATSSVQSAISNVEAARAMSASSEAMLKVAKAKVVLSEADVRDSLLQLSYCWILAPADGWIARKTVETGQRLSTGQSLLAVVEDDVWVLANLKETQLEKLRVGQHCKIKIDAFPDHPFDGKVDSFQSGTGAAFALLPPDNATGNFTKIVQRVPVKLVFDAGGFKGYENRVVPGLSAVPTIDLEEK